MGAHDLRISQMKNLHLWLKFQNMVQREMQNLVLE